LTSAEIISGEDGIPLPLALRSLPVALLTQSGVESI
jgi:hypothetical protein